MIREGYGPPFLNATIYHVMDARPKSRERQREEQERLRGYHGT